MELTHQKKSISNLNKTQFAKVAKVSTQTLLSHIRLLQPFINDTYTNSNTNKAKTEIYLKWLC